MPTRAPGTGYANWDHLFGLQQDGAQRLVDGIAAPVEQQGDAARAEQEAFGREFGSVVADAGQGKDYHGPETLAGYDPKRYAADGLQSAHAAQQAQMAGSYGGQRALLAQQTGSPGHYSAGQGRYDQALAQSAGAGRLRADASQYGGLNAMFGVTNDAATARVAEQRARPTIAPVKAPRPAPYTDGGPVTPTEHAAQRAGYHRNANPDDEEQDRPGRVTRAVY
jgi:hypothetical protein